jgi:D-alanine-D-alanine ligase
MTTRNARLKVGVLFGGVSAEHDISILSARSVLAALDTDLFEPIPIGISRAGEWRLQSVERLLNAKGEPHGVKLDGSGTEITVLSQLCRGPRAVAATANPLAALDVIFPVLHGPMGEDGSMQGLLELAGIPYVGAGVLGSAVGMDKDVMKRLLRDAGVPIPRFQCVRHHDYRRDPLRTLAQVGSLGLPLFVKPANLGSSVGVSRVTTRAQLSAAMELAFSYDLKVLVEEAIVGREIECAVLGDDEPVASIAGEITVRHRDGFYSYDAKYLDGDATELLIPAPIPAETTREVQRLSLATFRALECSGLARVDFFLRPNGTLLVNEINTLPGFTAVSMYPKLWSASGVSPRELTTRLVDLALERFARRRVRQRTDVMTTRVS